MAAATLPAPGTKLGSCQDDCKHRDCAETRAMAATLCRICGEPIGYECRFFQERDTAGNRTTLVHESCAYEEIAK